MAMFTDSAYADNGHITSLNAWQLEMTFSENDLKVLECRFHDAPFFPPGIIRGLCEDSGLVGLSLGGKLRNH